MVLTTKKFVPVGFDVVKKIHNSPRKTRQMVYALVMDPTSSLPEVFSFPSESLKILGKVIANALGFVLFSEQNGGLHF